MDYLFVPCKSYISSGSKLSCATAWRLHRSSYSFRTKVANECIWCVVKDWWRMFRQLQVRQGGKQGKAACEHFHRLGPQEKSDYLSAQAEKCQIWPRFSVMWWPKINCSHCNCHERLDGGHTKLYGDEPNNASPHSLLSSQFTKTLFVNRIHQGDERMKIFSLLP